MWISANTIEELEERLREPIANGYTTRGEVDFRIVVENYEEDEVKKVRLTPLYRIQLRQPPMQPKILYDGR